MSKKIDIERLITPSAYAKTVFSARTGKLGVSPAAITKQMGKGQVEFVEIKGGRLIVLPE
jgi:hypothetical protein